MPASSPPSAVGAAATGAGIPVGVPGPGSVTATGLNGASADPPARTVTPPPPPVRRAIVLP